MLSGIGPFSGIRSGWASAGWPGCSSAMRARARLGAADVVFHPFACEHERRRNGGARSQQPVDGAVAQAHHFVGVGQRCEIDAFAPRARHLDRRAALAVRHGRRAQHIAAAHGELAHEERQHAEDDEQP
ncbi:hypothetical protein [Pseudoxanthomonas mexicana]|uniref:hypothetical protein n=1 Tax=Pseudoxanthomonas mexicana TaxID=128785 RepID=UPI001FD63C39|nr:hypothetical protein [Pseudoxanthomonas mexicana]UOV00424.1 hypothetical protein MUU73_10350 [Pseudoxanthomonas mexicana]